MKKIFLLLVILIAISSALAYTNYVKFEKECNKDGGTWIIDECNQEPCPYNQGHCEYPISTPTTSGGGGGPVTTSSAIRLHYPEPVEEVVEEIVQEEPVQQQTTEETLEQGNPITGGAVSEVDGFSVKNFNLKNLTEQGIAMFMGILVMITGLFMYYREKTT